MLQKIKEKLLSLTSPNIGRSNIELVALNACTQYALDKMTEQRNAAQRALTTENRRVEELAHANDILAHRGKSYRQILRDMGVEVEFDTHSYHPTIIKIQEQHLASEVAPHHGALPEVRKKPWEDKSYPIGNALMPMAEVVGKGVVGHASITETVTIGGREAGTRTANITITNTTNKSISHD